MENNDSSRESRASEEVDGPPEAQRRRTDNRAFTGLGCVLNTSGLSAGGLFRIAATAPGWPIGAGGEGGGGVGAGGRRGHGHRGECRRPHQAA
jgi:hypothetical protein